MATPDINKILRAGRRSAKYGAPMGANDVAPSTFTTGLYLQRVRFVDGDYGADGTYWGGYPSEPLWCCFSEDEAATVRVYLRATSRLRAAIALARQYPNLRLRRPV